MQPMRTMIPIQTATMAPPTQNMQLPTGLSAPNGLPSISSMPGPAGASAMAAGVLPGGGVLPPMQALPVQAMAPGQQMPVQQLAQQAVMPGMQGTGVAAVAAGSGLDVGPTVAALDGLPSSLFGSAVGDLPITDNPTVSSPDDGNMELPFDFVNGLTSMTSEDLGLTDDFTKDEMWQQIFNSAVASASDS